VNLSRADRERIAFDSQGVWEQSHAWHQRGRHVFECPNTLRYEQLFDQLTARYAVGKTALDVGCGFGESSKKLLARGARFVRGIDISESAIARAQPGAIQGRLEFVRTDVQAPLDGCYDLIFGRSILHHLDYRPMLTRLYERNLSPGGALVFMEPLGNNLVSVLFRTVVRSAHTPDERSFTRDDLRWFRDSFAQVDIYPYNYLSYPFGILSSVVGGSADNAALRFCDRVDEWLAAKLRFLESRFRQAVIVVSKPALPHALSAASVSK
jgi:SAM-dependent methyltransferase